MTLTSPLSIIPKRPFKPRLTSGSLPIRKGKLVTATKQVIKVTPLKRTQAKVVANKKVVVTAPPKRTQAKMVANKKVVTETTFKPYFVPKLSKPRIPPPPSSAASPPTSAAASFPASMGDKTWRLRNYDGVNCMVIVLEAQPPTVTIRTSEMIDCKIPPKNDSRVRDWTKVFPCEDEAAALQLAKSTLAKALDDDYTQGTCPNCNGPGRFTEAQLSEKEGLLRAGVTDGRGIEAICPKCSKREAMIASLQCANPNPGDETRNRMIALLKK